MHYNGGCCHHCHHSLTISVTKKAMPRKVMFSVLNVDVGKLCVFEHHSTVSKMRGNM